MLGENAARNEAVAGFEGDRLEQKRLQNRERQRRWRERRRAEREAERADGAASEAGPGAGPGAANGAARVSLLELRVKVLEVQVKRLSRELAAFRSEVGIPISGGAGVGPAAEDRTEVLRREAREVQGRRDALLRGGA